MVYLVLQHSSWIIQYINIYIYIKYIKNGMQYQVFSPPTGTS